MALIPLQQTLNTGPIKRAHFSKWVSLEILLDAPEMTHLFEILEPVHLISSTPLNKENPFYLQKSLFIEKYDYYVSQLKKGQVPDLSTYKSYFYLFLSTYLEGISRFEVQPNKEVLSLNTPTLTLKPICLHFSKADHSIRVGPLNPNGILWGLQLSFPHLMQAPNSHEITPISPQTNPNAKLFKQIRTWVRSNTKPVQFHTCGHEIKTNFRLGKGCYEWIIKHPQIPSSLTIVP
ncbi:MAG: hypothetical protein S4CHLAM7_08750 [Chlamydiae bacterium]|nr:hypothetical protein [Chlamydiota bacterium]